MRLSEIPFVTEREPPADVADEVEGLLRRAGYLQPTGPGRYVFGPLMLRVVQRVEAILLEEFGEAGYARVHAPALRTETDHPLGPESPPLARPELTVTDRRGGTFRLGPDGAGAVLDLADRHVRSYRDLPVRVVDRRTGFGDVEDRSGLLHARESPRVDVYTFTADRPGCDAAHDHVLAVLERALERTGVDHVTARAGAPPGAAAATVVAPTEDGPDRIVRSPGGGVATPHASRARPQTPQPPEQRPMREVETPGAVTIDALREFLPDVPRARMMKTLLYRAEMPGGTIRTVAALCRGDRQIDEVKLRRHLGAAALDMADPLEVREVTGAQVGYAGPVGLPEDVRVVADPSAAELRGFACGANRTDVHLVDVHFGRDLPEPEAADIDLTLDGDRSAGGAPLSFVPVVRLVDAHQIAPETAGRTVRFTDTEGQERDCWCHRAAADLLRIVHATVLQHRGEERLRWPLPVAPHSVVIVHVRVGDEAQDAVASDVHRRLVSAGVDVVWDDRDERAGVKFGDAELIGVPIRLTVGRDADDGRVELILSDGEPQVVPVGTAVDRIVGLVAEAGVPALR